MDPYWAYVKALLHFDGNLVNSAPTNATFSTSTTGYSSDIKIDGQSLDFRPSLSNVAGGGGTDLAFASNDFCVEMASYVDPAITTRGSHYFSIEMYGGQGVVGLIRGTQSGQEAIQMTGSPPNFPVAGILGPGWNHVAVTRQGSLWSLWMNGQLASTFTYTRYFGVGAQIYLGNGSSGGSSARYLLEEFRITIGVPRYTAPFTPIMPFPNRGP